MTPAAGATITPLAGIRARAGSGVNVTAAQGSLGDVPLPAIVPGDGPGFAASYWNNGDFSGAPALTRTDPTVDLAAAPAGVGPLWSARWTGTVTPTESGLYRFSLLQAGLATLWVDGQRVGPGYREGVQFLAGPRYPMQAAVRLTAGKPVAIRIDYSSSAQLFGAQVHLAWQPPSASGIPAAVEAARHADAAIVLANNGQGEGMDRTTLALPGDQDQLIDAVAAVNRRTVVVLNTGGPVLMPWLHHVEGVLQAWYPGQQFGAALASVLFGDSDPGGRLPVTFPASDAQGPAPATRPERYPGVDGAAALRRGHLRRLPLVRPVPPAAAVPVRLRPLLRGLPLRRRSPARRSGRRDGDDARDEHEPALRVDRRAGLPVLPAVGRRAAAPAQGVREGPARAGSQRGRHVPTRPRRPGLLRRGRATGRSSPTGATRCRWEARRATCPRARASSWDATTTAEPRRRPGYAPAR